MTTFHSLPVVNWQCAPNQDVLIRISDARLATAALPGQYVFIRTDVNAHLIRAYVLTRNIISAYLDVLVSSQALNSVDVLMQNQLLVSELAGDAFAITTELQRPVVLADEYGLPSAIFLSQILGTLNKQTQPLVILESKKGFPFTLKPSQFMIPSMPHGVIAACPLLEDKKIPSRLVSEEFMPGCYEGSMVELLEEWLPIYQSLNENLPEWFICARNPLLSDLIKLTNSAGLLKQAIEVR